MEDKVMKITKELDNLNYLFKKILKDYEKALQDAKDSIQEYSHEHTIKELVTRMCELPDRTDITEDEKAKVYTELELRYTQELEFLQRDSSVGEKIVMHDIERKIGWTW